jgi:hypothetical protein
MTAALNTLKGQLKMDSKLSAIANQGKKDNKRGKHKKNNKYTNFCHEQKRNKVWEKEPSKEGNKKEKNAGKYTYHWCKHHMVWSIYKLTDCILGKQHKKEQNKKPQKANSSTVTTTATSTMNLHFAALMAAMGNLQEEL